jgi:chloramphenicol 3-O phosphotransferase
MADPTHQLSRPGRIVVLNGAPRSGKSSVAAAMLAGFPGVWLNLGVDLAMAALPERLWPGIGLRPGGERPDLEPLLPALYAGLYEAVAAHSRLGLNVVVDVGHHEAHSRPLGILPDCARRLAGLPVLFVGLRCPVGTILARRRRAEPGRAGVYVAAGEGEAVPAPVLAWQAAVHDPGVYDLELDTSVLTPEACVAAIEARLRAGGDGPSAFERLAGPIGPGA